MSAFSGRVHGLIDKFVPSRPTFIFLKGTQKVDQVQGANRGCVTPLFPYLFVVQSVTQQGPGSRTSQTLQRFDWHILRQGSHARQLIFHVHRHRSPRSPRREDVVQQPRSAGASTAYVARGLRLVLVLELKFCPYFVVMYNVFISAKLPRFPVVLSCARCVRVRLRSVRK